MDYSRSTSTPNVYWTRERVEYEVDRLNELADTLGVSELAVCATTISNTPDSPKVKVEEWYVGTVVNKNFVSDYKVFTWMYEVEVYIREKAGQKIIINN